MGHWRGRVWLDCWRGGFGWVTGGVGFGWIAGGVGFGWVTGGTEPEPEPEATLATDLECCDGTEIKTASTVSIYVIAKY